MQWEGSVIAPETGDYEIVIKTEHATRLWLNDPETPFIDAWVKSGDDTEYREKVSLLGGRAYPLRLEFSKAKHATRASVHVAAVKDVTKPAGTKPGLVYVHRGRTLQLRRDPKRLERVLASRKEE